MPACGGALMPGHAFSIEDALVASRWAEQILPHGCRVVITPRYKDAEKIIEVYLPAAKTPVFRVHRTPRPVLVTDCIGLTLSFPTLADALLAMAPLSKSGRREIDAEGSKSSVASRVCGVPDRKGWPHVASRGQSHGERCIAAGQLAPRLTLQGNVLVGSASRNNKGNPMPKPTLFWIASAHPCDCR